MTYASTRNFKPHTHSKNNRNGEHLPQVSTPTACCHFCSCMCRTYIVLDGLETVKGMDTLEPTIVCLSCYN
jgi:hypothetical protein